MTDTLFPDHRLSDKLGEALSMLCDAQVILGDALVRDALGHQAWCVGLTEANLNASINTARLAFGNSIRLEPKENA